MRVGAGNLDFYRVSHSASGQPRRLFLTKYIPQPFHAWWFRESELVASTPDDDLRMIDIDPTKLAVDYRATHANWFAQDEVQLFARDPVEAFLYLKDPNTYLTDQEWRAETGLRLPQGVALTYPPQPTQPLATNGVDFATPPVVALVPDVTQFWGNNVPDGPGAAPNGKGSIKAARVVNHGLCSAELPYVTGDVAKPGLLEQIDLTFFFGMIDAVRSMDGCTDVIRRYSHWTPLLRQQEDKEDGQHGVVLFDGSYATKGHANDQVDIRVWYTLRLYDGLLSVESGVNEGIGVSGSFAPLVAGVLQSALSTPAAIVPQGGRPVPQQANLAGKILEASWAQQEYHGLDLSSDQNLITDECHPDPAAVVFGGAPGSVPVVPYDATDPLDSSKTCLHFLKNQIEAAAFATGGMQLIPPLTANEQEVIKKTVRATYERDGRTFYKHVVCRPVQKPAPGDEGKSRCEYIVRARRLVAHPNAAELVFLDSDRELANPTFPVWLILSAGTPHTDLVSKLCSRQPQAIDSQRPFYARPFTSVYGNYLLAPHQGSPCL